MTTINKNKQTNKLFTSYIYISAEYINYKPWASTYYIKKRPIKLEKKLRK